MKLERISENQIRCTLTRSDLAERELKISELAYGTEKAKALFREMMVQASDELGFEADNIPLIIEAVPVSNECIMLIVTKVEDPEELDTRFSKFTPSPEDTEDLSDTDDEIYSSADDILDIFKRLGSDILSKTAELHSISGTADLPSDTETTSDDASSEDEEPQKTILRIYEFRTLNEVSCLSEQLPADFKCGNTLYKNPNNGHYYLVLSSEGVSRTVFGSICRLASEFGSIQKASQLPYIILMNIMRQSFVKTHCRFFEAYKKCMLRSDSEFHMYKPNKKGYYIAIVTFSSCFIINRIYRPTGLFLRNSFCRASACTRTAI